MRQIEGQNDFRIKNADNIFFLSKIWEYWTDVHLNIVKLKSRGQSVIKKNHSGNRFNLEISSFFIKNTKTCVFTQIIECSIVTHLHYPELKWRPYIQPQTNEKIFAYPIQPQKK